MKKNLFTVAIVGFIVFTMSATAFAAPSLVTACDVASCGDTYFEAEPFEGELCEEAEASNLASFIPEKAEEATLCSESIYDVLANGMRQMESKIDISSFEISKNNIAALNEYHINTLYMNPELYYVSSYYTYWYNGKGLITAVSPKYLVTNKDEIENSQSQIEAAVDELVAYTDSSMTDIEKLLTVYDRIVLSGSYDDSLQLRTAKNLLLDGKSVCAGYASAFYTVATRLGIPCGFVRSEDMNHVWNAVCVEDTWYHVDMTWDDTPHIDSLRVTHEYFLKSNAWMENEGDHYGFTFIEDNCEKYDDYFWNAAVSQTIILENNIYYIDGSTHYGSVSSYNKDTGEVSKIYEYDTLWPTAASSSHWLGAYAGLAFHNNRLYFNTWNEILSCELDGTDIKVELTLPETADTSIYGCRIEENKLYYVAGKKENPYSITETHYIDLLETEDTDISVESITLDSDNIEITVGETFVLTAMVAPLNATNKNVIWDSSDVSVATVLNGKVTAVSKGEATITVTTEDGAISACCTIKVVDPVVVNNVLETQPDKSIRVNGKSGIRFKATLEKSADASAFGWIVTREAILKGNNIDPADFTLESPVLKWTGYNYGNGVEPAKIFESNDEKDCFTVVVYSSETEEDGYPSAHKLSEKVVARPFAVIDGVTVYGEAIEPTSIYDVAFDIYNNADSFDILDVEAQAYISGLVEKVTAAGLDC